MTDEREERTDAVVVLPSMPDAQTLQASVIQRLAARAAANGGKLKVPAFLGGILPPPPRRPIALAKKPDGGELGRVRAKQGAKKGAVVKGSALEVLGQKGSPRGLPYADE